MREYIRKLQSKNEDTRKLILAGTMIVSMSFVAFVWVYSLGFRFNSETKAQAREDIRPFKLFGNSIKDTYNGVTASVGKISLKKDSQNEKQIDLIPVEDSNTNTQ